MTTNYGHRVCKVNYSQFDGTAPVPNSKLIWKAKTVAQIKQERTKNSNDQSSAPASDGDELDDFEQAEQTKNDGMSTSTFITFHFPTKAVCKKKAEQMSNILYELTKVECQVNSPIPSHHHHHFCLTSGDVPIGPLFVHCGPSASSYYYLRSVHSNHLLIVCFSWGQEYIPPTVNDNDQAKELAKKYISQVTPYSYNNDTVQSGYLTMNSLIRITAADLLNIPSSFFAKTLVILSKPYPSNIVLPPPLAISAEVDQSSSSSSSSSHHTSTSPSSSRSKSNGKSPVANEGDVDDDDNNNDNADEPREKQINPEIYNKLTYLKHAPSNNPSFSSAVDLLFTRWSEHVEYNFHHHSISLLPSDYCVGYHDRPLGRWSLCLIERRNLGRRMTINFSGAMNRNDWDRIIQQGFVIDSRTKAKIQFFINQQSEKDSKVTSQPL